MSVTTDDTYVCFDFSEAIDFWKPNTENACAWLKQTLVKFILCFLLEEISLRISDSFISSSRLAELLGTAIDRDLTFAERINHLCTKASQKR